MLTAICLLTLADSSQLSKSTTLTFKSEKLLSLFKDEGVCGGFGEVGLAVGRDLKLWNKSVRDSLSTHYLLQNVCRVYVRGLQILFEDPDASESECNLSNSSESLDESGDLDSNSDASNSQKSEKADKPK